MKTEQYEIFVDGCIEWSKITGLAIACSAIIFFILMVIFTFIESFILSEMTYSVLYHVLPASVIMSAPITLFGYWYRKAYKNFAIKRFRDFWLGFSTLVELDYEKSRKDNEEISEWIDEYTCHMHKTTASNCFRFAAKSDAVAFKMRWL